MKPRRHNRWNRNDGYTLMAAAIAAGVLSILVVGYLSWVTNEYRLSQRSDRWNQALYLAEAGVEVGLAEFNFKYRPSPGSAFSTGSGWTAASGSYSKTVSNFTDNAGQVLGTFVVEVNGISMKYPTITCTGTALNPSGGPTVTRTVRVVLRRNNVYPFGLLSVQEMQLSASAGTIVLDSFDSSDSTKSTGGQYDAAKRQSHGNIASMSTAVDAIALKNVDVYGDVNTGAGGVVDFKSATVGSTTDPALRSSTEADAEAAGWLAHDFNAIITSVFLPPELASASSLGDIKDTMTISSGDWHAKEISASSGIITISGDVRLYVAGKISLGGLASLVIAPGSSLEIYVGGPVSIMGNGIVNLAGKAEYNAWYGLDSSTDWDVGGNGVFIGTAYAPNADLKLNGNPEYIGAFIGKTITTVGNPGIHYDEALKQSVGNYAYGTIAWEPIIYSGGTWVLETN